MSQDRNEARRGYGGSHAGRKNPLYVRNGGTASVVKKLVDPCADRTIIYPVAQIVPPQFVNQLVVIGAMVPAVTPERILRVGFFCPGFVFLSSAFEFACRIIFWQLAR